MFAFESLRKDAAINSGGSAPSLRTLCPTRWTVRHAAINSILLNYEILLKTLDFVAEVHDEYAAKAHGLYMKMESFETYFGLKLAHKIFSAAEQLSMNLQAKDITVQEASRGAVLLVSHLKTLQTESHFDAFYEQTLVQSSSVTEEPKLPRYRKMPKRLDEGGSPHRYSNPKDKYRHDYFEVFELASGEIKRRFEQSDMSTIVQLEMLLISAANSTMANEIPETVSAYLGSDVDVERLKVQLLMLPDMVKTASEGQIKAITNVRTIASLMEQSKIYKGMLSETDKLLKIYFTFPVTLATAERSFSALCRIKTFLRTTMTHSRLNNLFLLYTHVAKTDSLDLQAVAQEIVGVNSRRMHYFGKF